MSVTEMLLVLWSGAAMSMIGTLIGGILVFRTRRDSHESLFAPRRPADQETAINLDDFAGSFEQEQEEEEDLTPDLFGAKNREFLRQLAERKTDDPGTEKEEEKGNDEKSA